MIFWFGRDNGSSSDLPGNWERKRGHSGENNVGQRVLAI